MSIEENSYAYRQDVLDMVTISVQICLLLEHTHELEKADFIKKLLQLLPTLYIKTISLDKPNAEIEGYLQTFVSEEDYNLISQNIADLLGNDDSYLDVFIEEMRYSDTPITCFISENLADIYQELKDMAGNFSSGNEQVMADAVYASLESFHNHWGQKLVNTLQALHSLYEQDDESDI